MITSVAGAPHTLDNIVAAPSLELHARRGRHGEGLMAVSKDRQGWSDYAVWADAYRPARERH